MTPLQTLEIRAGEIRGRLAELGAMPDMTDETRGELDRLRNEYTDNDRKRAALVIAGDVPSKPHEEGSEGRALRELLKRSSVGDVFEAAISSRMVTGATAELQGHYHLDGNQVPIALLRRAEGDDLETRATGPTPAPANVGQNQAEIIPAVFPMSCAAYLGIDMPVVGVGEATFPVLTTSAVAGVPVENNAQDETAGAFMAEVLSPARIQAAFFYSREDRARFAGMSEALRQNLSDALQDKLDQQVLAGTNGLFTATNLDNHAASAVTTFANYKADLAYARVDGRYANGVEELRIVMGSASYAHAATVYRAQGNASDAVDAALDVLMAKTGGVKVSAHVPAVASSKQNAVIRLGMRRDMVAALWEGLTLIPDEITLASKGQIQITAVMLHAVKIIRADGFYKQELQHA